MMKCLAIVLALMAPAAAGQVTADVVGPTLIGGTPADPEDWPASPWVGNCSSTLVGERTLLTAAHCVSNGGTKQFTIGTTRYSGACTHHPSYRSNSTADWALCHLTTAVTGVPFEVVADGTQMVCTRGMRVLWTGYGCQRWGGQIDGRFRTGSVGVTSCPQGTSSFDTVTTGSVALCSGDSGGGGYLERPDGSRLVIGVNSRSNTTDTSYVSSTYNATFRTWADSWAATRGTSICGVTAGATGCRGASEPPPPLGDCQAELAAYDLSLTAAEVKLDTLRACIGGTL